MTSIYKKLAFAVSPIIILLALFITIQNANAAQYVRVTRSGGQQTIDVFSTCRIVTNNNTDDVFVPTNTSPEWSAFLTHLPPNVTAVTCSASVVGCMTSGYDNYDASANSPGVCFCYSGRTWNGSTCVNNVVTVVGCMTPGYDNYNASANSPGSCSCNSGRHWDSGTNQCVANTSIIYGCMTSGYDNYDPTATSPTTCSCNAYRSYSGGTCTYETCTSVANACFGGVAGTYNSSGVCSGVTPSLPANYGNSCPGPANTCGATQSDGTIQCDGSCSSTAPPLPAGYGSSCPSAANTCGTTQSNGTIQCDLSCSSTVPATPGPSSCSASNVCGSNPGLTNECGVGCDAVAPYCNPGCTDSSATNFDPTANYDDGSCIPPTLNWVCSYSYPCTQTPSPAPSASCAPGDDSTVTFDGTVGCNAGQPGWPSEGGFDWTISCCGWH